MTIGFSFGTVLLTLYFYFRLSDACDIKQRLITRKIIKFIFFDIWIQFYIIITIILFYKYIKKENYIKYLNLVQK